MDKKIGFIGAGNMAKAMMGGIIGSGMVTAENIIASDGYAPSLEAAKKQYGIQTTLDNKEVVAFSDIIFLAVKPNVYGNVMEEIKADLGEKIIVTIAPGKTLDYMAKGLGVRAKVLRTMPNTPAMVGEGATAICPNENITAEELFDLRALISTFGMVEQVGEYLFDDVTAISGSSPAYVFMFIEAMADGAVKHGMARAQAYQMAAQAVLGSAKMVLETGKHPAELKDMVCSPGGTTIDAVAVLEENGFRSAVIKAVEAATLKSAKL